jgi:hypothetical protein
MPIPAPFTPAALSAGVLTNIASDILKHYVQVLEGTLAGRVRLVFESTLTGR